MIDVFKVGDVVVTEDGSEATVTVVMEQEEGPAYWVRFNDTRGQAVLFHEEVSKRPPTVPTVQETAERIKAEVLADLGVAVSSRGDVMPTTVSSFAELHDYVDANTYGGMCSGLYDLLCSDVNDVAANDAWMSHCDEAIDIVDAWLRAGRPTTTTEEA